MALIIQCRSCRQRVAEEAQRCPGCGSAAFRYIVDYWPKGRRGGRKKLALPEATASAAAARIIERAILAAAHPPETASSARYSTVADLFPDYLTWYRLHRATTTARDVSFAWDACLKPLLGDYPVRTIGQEHFHLYQQKRKAGFPEIDQPRKCRIGRIPANRTVNKELDYFSGFLKWCRREKRIEIEPLHYEKLPANRPLPMVLSPEEIAAILRAAEAEPLYRTFFLCLYTLGLRFSEARGLRLVDFDFAIRAVRVRQKGGSWKILPLNDQVVEAVGALAKKQGCGPEDYLFASSRLGDRDQKRPVRDIRAAIARICKVAGVKKKVTPHLFRHSIATHLLGADVNMRTIQQYLGHAQVATTEFYTHVALGHLRSAQETIFGKDLQKSEQNQEEALRMKA